MFVSSEYFSEQGRIREEGREDSPLSAGLMRAGICSSLPQVPSAPQDTIHKAKWIFMGKCCGRKFEQFWIMMLISLTFPNSKIFIAFYPISFLLPADFIDKNPKSDVA